MQLEYGASQFSSGVGCGRILNIMLAFKFAGLVYLASVKKKFAAKCKKHAIFFNELIKQQTVRLAECIEGAK